MRIVVGISNRDVEYLQTLLHKTVYEKIWLGQVKPVVLGCAESVRLWYHVRNTQAACQQNMGRNCRLYGAKTIQIKSCAIFKAAAIATLAPKCR